MKTKRKLIIPELSERLYFLKNDIIVVEDRLSYSFYSVDPIHTFNDNILISQSFKSKLDYYIKRHYPSMIYKTKHYSFNEKYHKELISFMLTLLK
jgi:hypothetical protein